MPRPGSENSPLDRLYQGEKYGLVGFVKGADGPAAGFFFRLMPFVGEQFKLRALRALSFLPADFGKRRCFSCFGSFDVVRDLVKQDAAREQSV